MSNEYIKRKVAMKDMQPCMICSKPATTVLYNQTLRDWIYTCDIHLQDNPSFVVPIHSQEYNDTVAKLQLVKQKLKEQASNGSGSWDTWVNKMFSKKNSKEDKDQKVATDNDTETKNESENTTDTTENFQDEYNKLLDKMTDLQSKVKNYKLDNTMFQHRLRMKRAQEIAIAKRKKEEANYSNTDPEELEKSFSFPSVPNVDPSKK